MTFITFSPELFAHNANKISSKCTIRISEMILVNLLGEAIIFYPKATFLSLRFMRRLTEKILVKTRTASYVNNTSIGCHQA